MALEIVECVLKVSMKIYATVDEVKANKKRCKRLAERIRCLVTPLNQLVAQGSNSDVYKESLIELVCTLEESRQFLKGFVRGKSVIKKLQDACYAKRVKEKFEDLNERLNILVPALTFGLQVECRKSVGKAFSQSTRLPEDIQDESCDLKDMQQLVCSLGMSTFQSVRASDLVEKHHLTDTRLYTLYTAKYKMAPVIVKKPRFDVTSVRREVFLNDAKNMLLFNSEDVVRVFGICVEIQNSYLIVMEHMHRGSLHKVLQNDDSLSRHTLRRMCVETSRGLYFVHCCDIIHRNLSATKYLVNDDLHVKITGFEFSVTETSVEEATNRVATCCFPDDLNTDDKELYTEKTDVFRYGLVLCEIVTTGTLNHHQTSDYTAVCAEKCLEKLQNLTCHNDAADVAIACLQKDKFLRPTMEDVVRKLTAQRKMRDQAPEE